MKAYFLNLIAKVKAWWNNHGTKILGTLSSINGSVLLAQGELQLSSALHRALVLLGIALGSLTVKRGFTNSQNLK